MDICQDSVILLPHETKRKCEDAGEKTTSRHRIVEGGNESSKSRPNGRRKPKLSEPLGEVGVGWGRAIWQAASWSEEALESGRASGSRIVTCPRSGGSWMG